MKLHHVTGCTNNLTVLFGVLTELSLPHFVYLFSIILLLFNLM